MEWECLTNQRHIDIYDNTTTTIDENAMEIQTNGKASTFHTICRFVIRIHMHALQEYNLFCPTMTKQEPSKVQ